MYAWLLNSKCKEPQSFDKITVHASATPPNQEHTVDSVRKMHQKRGWSDIGYHILIRRNGYVEIGRPWAITGAHVYGHNRLNLGICMVGGIDSKGEAEDNFTEEQYDSLREVISVLSGHFGIKRKNIKGHRDYSPDLNADGIISPDEYVKQCPCFSVADKLVEWEG